MGTQQDLYGNPVSSDAAALPYLNDFAEGFAACDMRVLRILDIAAQDASPLLQTWCAALHLFATTSMGIFLATLARSMPQFGMLLVLVLLPLQLLSGGATPRESMPELVQNIMLAAPTTYFVSAGQAILYRGAGIDVVWPQFLAILGIGSVLFFSALARFRKALSQLS